MDTTARTKINRKLNRRQKILRQHTANKFLVLIYEINLRNYHISSNKHP